MVKGYFIFRLGLFYASFSVLPFPCYCQGHSRQYVYTYIQITWILWQGKIYRQFRLLLQSSCIGQKNPLGQGMGWSKVISVEYRYNSQLKETLKIIRVCENLSQYLRVLYLVKCIKKKFAFFSVENFEQALIVFFHTCDAVFIMKDQLRTQEAQLLYNLYVTLSELENEVDCIFLVY